MYTPPTVKRVILVVADGLRSDAIARFDLASIRRMMREGSSTLAATTVTPSVTAAAMTSLLTGVTPERHGIKSDTFFLPSPRQNIRPMPKVLADAGIATGAFMRELPGPFRPLAKQIAHRLGLTSTTFAGKDAKAILAAYYRRGTVIECGLTIMHWPDADQAGHEHGWMSEGYGRAAKDIDDALGTLMGMMELLHGPETVLILLADHGGGGGNPKRHDSAHPLDRTIPIVLYGGAISPGEIRPLSTILDVSATIVWALGVAVPESYSGRPFFEAFEPAATLSVVL